jgi:16S rRNA processing protein RimM
VVRGAADAAAPPPDRVTQGAVRGAYGVRGWVRIALAGSESVLAAAPVWWLEQHGAWRAVEPEAMRRHGALLLAKWPGCDTKEAADALKGAQVAVARSAFPPAGAGEFYWADLAGCRVVNRAGEPLGEVRGLRENAGGQWLEVDDGTALRLIPLVEAYVDEVDPAARCVRVDWQRDW